MSTTLEEILTDKILAEVKRHHLSPGFMASPSHEGYKTWGVTCANYYDNPDTDCEFSEWGHATKEEAKATWYRHLAESILATVSRNKTEEGSDGTA